MASVCFPKRSLSCCNAENSSLHVAAKIAKVVAIALIVIGALALILLYAQVLTPAILAAISLSNSSVAILGFCSFAVGGITLSLFACKCVRKYLSKPKESESSGKTIQSSRVSLISPEPAPPLPVPSPAPTTVSDPAPAPTPPTPPIDVTPPVVVTPVVVSPSPPSAPPSPPPPPPIQPTPPATTPVIIPHVVTIASIVAPIIIPAPMQSIPLAPIAVRAPISTPPRASTPKTTATTAIATTALTRSASLTPPKRREAKGISLYVPLNTIEAVFLRNEVIPKQSQELAVTTSLVAGLIGDGTRNSTLDGVNLEGGTTANSGEFIRSLLDQQRRSKEYQSKEFPCDQLIASIDQLLAIDEFAKKCALTVPDDKQLQELMKCGYREYTDIEQVVQASQFADGMIERIAKMKAGDRLLIPGGWAGSPGHAILHELRIPTEGPEDTVEVTTYNTGSGLQFHKSALNDFERNAESVLTISCPLKALFRREPWVGLYTIGYTLPNTLKKSFSANDVYVGFLRSLNPGFLLDDRVVVSSPNENFDTPQRTGNCTTKVYMAFIRQKYRATYKARKLSFWLRAIEAYAMKLRGEGTFALLLTDTEEQIRTKKATLNFFRDSLIKCGRSAGKAIDNDHISEKTANETNELLRILQTACEESIANFEKAYPSSHPKFETILSGPTPGIEISLGSYAPRSTASPKYVEEQYGMRNLLSQKSEWPSNFSELHTHLEEWYKCLTQWEDRKEENEKEAKEKGLPTTKRIHFDVMDPKVYHFIKNMFAKMPSLIDPRWGQIPAEKAELCMERIAFFGETFVQTQRNLFNAKTFNIDNLCYLQHALLALQRIAQNLPEPFNEISKIVLPHRLPFDAITGLPITPYFPVVNPKTVRVLQDSLQVVQDVSKEKERKATDVFTLNIPHIEPRGGSQITVAPCKFQVSDKLVAEIRGSEHASRHISEAAFVDWYITKFHTHERGSGRAQTVQSLVDYNLQKLFRDRQIHSDHQRLMIALVDEVADGSYIMFSGFRSLKLLAIATELAYQEFPSSIVKIPFRQFHGEYAPRSTTESVSKYSYFSSLVLALRSQAPNRGDTQFLEALPVIKNPQLIAILNLMYSGVYNYTTQSRVMIAERYRPNKDMGLDEWCELMLLRCKEDRSQQPVKTIGHFRKYLLRLLDPDYQHFFTSMMFEADLLSTQLKIFPPFAFQLEAFVREGVALAKAEKNLTAELFFLRMGDQFQQRYHSLVEPETKGEAERKEHSNHLEALTNKARELKPTDSKETRSLVYREVLAAYGRRKSLDEKDLPSILQMLFFHYDHPASIVLPAEENPLLDEDVSKLANAVMYQIDAMLKKSGHETVSKILSEAIGKRTTKWDFSFYPHINGSEPNCRVDLSVGMYLPDGFKGGVQLSSTLTNRADFRALFPNPSRLTNIRNGGDYWRFTDEHGFEIQTSVGAGDPQIHKRISLKELQSSVHKVLFSSLDATERGQIEKEEEIWLKNYDCPLANFSFNHTCTCWQFENKLLFFERGSGRLRYIFLRNENPKNQLFIRIKENGEREDVELAGRKATNDPRDPYRPFKDFDDSVELWRWRNAEDRPVDEEKEAAEKYEKDNKIIELGFPRYGLRFDVSRKVICRAPYEDYELVEEHHKALERIPGYITLQKGMKKIVLIPSRKINFEHPSIKSLSNKLTFIEPPFSSASPLYEFGIDDAGELVGDTLEKRFYLCYLYLSQRDYNRTAKILSDFKKMSSYTDREYQLLSWIVMSTKGFDLSFRAVFLQLKALALMEDNCWKYGKTQWHDPAPDSVEKVEKNAWDEFFKNSFGSIVQSYLNQLAHDKSSELTLDEMDRIDKYCEQYAATMDAETVWPRYTLFRRNEGAPRRTQKLDRSLPKHMFEVAIQCHRPINLELLEYPPIIMAHESLGKDFLTYYAIAMNGNEEQKDRLKALLAWAVSGPKWDCIRARILEHVMKPSHGFPSLAEMEELNKDPIKLIDTLKKLSWRITQPESSLVTQESRPIAPRKVITKPIQQIDATLPSTTLFPPAFLFAEGETKEAERKTEGDSKRDSKEEKETVAVSLESSLQVAKHLRTRETFFNERACEKAYLISQSTGPIFSTAAGCGLSAEDELLGKEVIERYTVAAAGEDAFPVHQRNITELAVDVQCYLNERASTPPAKILNPGKLVLLKDALDHMQKNSGFTCTKMKEEIIALANKISEDSVDGIRDTLRRTRGKDRKPITIDELIVLVLRDNVGTFLERNEALTEEDVIELRAKIEFWFVQETRHQQIERCLKIIAEINNPETAQDIKEQRIQALQTQLTAQRHYTISNASKDKHALRYLVMEYRCNILFFKDQIDYLELLFKHGNTILQIPMGGGKTENITPELLMNLAWKAIDESAALGKFEAEMKSAEKPAEGTLAISIIPEELIAVVSEKLQANSGRIFGQEAHRVDWKRAGTVDGLCAIKEHLEQIIRNRAFLIVSTGEIHEFILNARENRYNVCNINKEDEAKGFAKGLWGKIETKRKEGIPLNPEEANYDKICTLKRAELLFREIKLILKKHGHIVIDEVDMELSVRKETQKALGPGIHLDPIYSQLTSVLYKTLNSEAIQKIFHFDGFSRHVKHPTAVVYTDESPERHAKGCKEMQEILAKAALKHLKEDLNFAIDPASPELLRFLTVPHLITPAGEVIKLPASMLTADNTRLREALGFVRGQIKVYMHAAAVSMYGKSFIFYPLKDGSHLPIAIPASDDKASEGSEFASFTEQMNLSILAYQKKGVSPWRIKQELQRLVTAINSQRTFSGAPVESTPGYREFMQMCGGKGNPEWLTSHTPTHLQRLSDLISDDVDLTTHFVAKYVLPKIKVFGTRISSNAQTLPEVFAKADAFSGTLVYENTFHKMFTPRRKRGIDGRTEFLQYKYSRDKISIIPARQKRSEGESKAILSEVEDKIVPRAIREQNEAIFRMETTLKLASIKFDDYHAIIDVGGMFKGAPHNILGEIILRNRRDLTAVFYFHDDMPMTLLKKDTGYEAVPGHSKAIHPSRRFTIYGPRQCTGTDIPQMETAQALVTLSRDSKFRGKSQGIWRMRGLHTGQRISYLLTDEFADLVKESFSKDGVKKTTLDCLDLSLFLKKPESRLEADNNLMGKRHAIANVAFQEYDRVLENISIGDLYTEAYRELNKLTLTSVEHSPYAQHGEPEGLLPAKVVLMKEKSNIVEAMEGWCKANPTAPMKPNFEQVGKDIQGIIDVTISRSLVNKMLPSRPDKMMGLAVALTTSTSVSVSTDVETQKKMELSLDIETELQRLKDMMNARLMLREPPHSKWMSLDITPLSIDVALARRRHATPISSVVYAVELLKREFRHYSGVKRTLSEPDGSLLGRLFGTDLLVSFDLFYTVHNEYPFGSVQKPLNCAMIVRSKEGRKIVLIDGNDAEQIRELFRKGSYGLPVGSEAFLLNIDTGIFDASSRKMFEERELDAVLLDCRNLILKMKFMKGDVWGYTLEQERQLEEWFKGEVDIDAVEKLFKSVFVKSFYGLFHYDDCQIARMFARIRETRSKVIKA